jgi:hypothetical protein
MMGGLLETLLLSRINKESDQSKIFKAQVAPKDGKTGKPLQLKDWALRNYIDVAHELKMDFAINKDIGAVLRDYRNYIHPFKQLSHGINLYKMTRFSFGKLRKAFQGSFYGET